MALRRTTTDGHSLLNEAETLIEQHARDLEDIAVRVASRHDDLSFRQSELEAEKKVLNTVRALVN